MADIDPKKDFIKRVNDHRQKHVDGLVMTLLKDMFEADSSFYDIFYIGQRARKIIDDAMEKVDFNSPEVADARRAFLKKLIANTKRKKPKPLKEDGKNPTSVRNNRCEPLAQMVADKILDEDLLFSDDYFLITGISEDDRLLFFNLMKGYIDAWMNGVEMSLNQSLAKANRAIWGCERDEIGMRQLDMVLKQK